MDNIAIGNYLLKLRTEKGLTQIQAAEILGVSNKAVSKWECGEALPSVEMLMALSKLYGVSVDEILQGSSKAEPQSQPLHRAKASFASNGTIFALLDVFAAITSILSIFLGYLLAFLLSLAAALWGSLIPLLFALGLLLASYFLDSSRNSSALRKTAAISLTIAAFATLFVIYIAIAASITVPISIESIYITGLVMVLIAFLALVPSIPLAIGIGRGSIQKAFSSFSSITGLTIAALVAITALEASNEWVKSVVIGGVDLLLITAAIVTLIRKKWHLLEGVLALMTSILAIWLHCDYSSLLGTTYSVLLLVFLITTTILKKKGAAALHESSLNE